MVALYTPISIPVDCNASPVAHRYSNRFATTDTICATEGLFWNLTPDFTAGVDVEVRLLGWVRQLGGIGGCHHSFLRLKACMVEILSISRKFDF